MVVWFLVLQVLFPGNSHTETQIGPFGSLKACATAAKLAKQELSGSVRTVCVPSEASNSN